MPAEQGALGDARVLGPLRTEVIARAVRGRAPDQLRQRLGQVAPALLALAQRLLGALEGGEVAGDAKRPYDRAVLVAQRHLGGGEPAHVAVEPDPLFLLAHQRPAGAYDLL